MRQRVRQNWRQMNRHTGRQRDEQLKRPAQVVKSLDQMTFGRLHWLSKHNLVVYIELGV